MSGSMRTVDHADAPSHAPLSRIRRDWALARRILGMLWFYFTEGRRVRKAYRARSRQGQTYWVDRPGGGQS